MVYTKHMNTTPETSTEEVSAPSPMAPRAKLYIGLAIVIVGLLVGLFAYNNQSQRINIVYQPVVACNLLTKSIAQEFLGKEVLGGNGDQEIGDSGTATSDCSYTDSNSDKNAMQAIIMRVRSGYDDTGAAQNKQDFAAHKQANNVQEVEGVGKQAFFNRTNSQLHILTDTSWIIISYTAGGAPTADAQDKTTAIAKRIFASK